MSLPVHRIPLFSFTSTTDLILLLQDPKISSAHRTNPACCTAVVDHISTSSETNYNNWMFAIKHLNSYRRGDVITNSDLALSSSSKRPCMFSFSWTTKKTSKKRWLRISMSCSHTILNFISGLPTKWTECPRHCGIQPPRTSQAHTGATRLYCTTQHSVFCYRLHQ